MSNLKVPSTSTALILYTPPKPLHQAPTTPSSTPSSTRGPVSNPSAFTNLKLAIPIKPLSDLEDGLKSSKLFQSMAMNKLTKMARLALPQEFPLIRSGLRPLRIEQAPEIMARGEARLEINALNADIKQKVGEIFSGLLKDITRQDVFLAGGAAIHLQHRDSSRGINDMDFRIQSSSGLTDFNSIEGQHVQTRSRDAIKVLAPLLEALKAPDGQKMIAQLKSDAKPADKEKEILKLKQLPKLDKATVQAIIKLTAPPSALVSQLKDLTALQAKADWMLKSPTHFKTMRDDEKLLFAGCLKPEDRPSISAPGNAQTMMHPSFFGVECSLSLSPWPHEPLKQVKGSSLLTLSDMDLMRDKIKTSISRDKRDEQNVSKVAQDLLDALSVAENLKDFRTELGFLKTQMQSRVEGYRLNNIESHKQVLAFSDDLLTLRMVDRFMRTLDSHLGPSADPQRHAKLVELVDGIDSSQALELGVKLQTDLRPQLSDARQQIGQELRQQFTQVFKLLESMPVGSLNDIRVQHAIIDTAEHFQTGKDLGAWFKTWNSTKMKPPLEIDYQVPTQPKLKPPLKDTVIDEALSDLPKGASHPEQVIWTLLKVGGFRPLGDTREDLNTIRAFGLSSTQFSKAFGELSKMGLVYHAEKNPNGLLIPDDDGFHIKAGKSIYDIFTAAGPANLTKLKAVIPPPTSNELVLHV